MAGEWALRWALLVLVGASEGDAPRKKLQVQYLQHSTIYPTAPYPSRRNLPYFGHRRQPSDFGTAESLQLFGDPLPGDNLTQTQVPRMHPFRPGLMSKQAKAGGFRPYQMPPHQMLDGHDLLELDEPLVTRQALGPPPPAVDLSQLAQIPGLPPPAPFEIYRLSQMRPSAGIQGPFGVDQPAYGLLPHGPFDLSQSQRGVPFGPQQASGLRPMNPWLALPVPTAMGPYHRRLKPKLMAEVQFQTSLAPLRDIEDPKKSATKVRKTYDSWQGAPEGGVAPPEPEMFAPLAPPPMPARNRSSLRQSGKVHKKENSIQNMLKHFPRFFEDKGSEETSTHWQYKFVTDIILDEKSSRPPPALLSEEEGFMEELVPESNDASLFSDAAKPVKRLSSNTSAVQKYYNNDMLL